MSDTNLHDVALDEQYMDDQSTAAESRCEKATPVEVDLPTGFVNKLSPPAGTDYWRCQSFTLLEDYELGFTHNAEKFLFETLTWRIDAYVYVVNSKPDDPNFAHNGGAVYVVLVHSGSAERGGIADPGLEYRFDVVLTPLVGGVDGAAMKQLPASNSGTKNGDVTNYPLSFVQDMQMFRSKGNETFTFSAQYEDSVDIHKGQQVGFVKGSSGTHWHLTFDTANPGANFPLTALSVFRFPSCSEVSFSCTASIGCVAPAQKVTRGIAVDCCF